jgi:hypothetical protein
MQDGQVSDHAVDKVLTANLRVQRYVGLRVEILDTQAFHDALVKIKESSEEMVEVEIVLDNQKAEMTISEFKEKVFGKLPGKESQ